MKLDSQFWDERYLSKETGWDLSRPSPPIEAYIDQWNDLNSRVMIPGCGNAYEAEYLLKKGFTNITLIDLSKVLTDGLKKKFENNPNIRIIHDNFFQHKGKYDLILEQTFFCAIDPELRKAYVRQMSELLEDGGTIAGLLFNTNFDRQGPPFGGDKVEYLELFESHFNIQTMETAHNSIAPRSGNELFIILKKQSSI